jgi:hypothetical protein
MSFTSKHQEDGEHLRLAANLVEQTAFSLAGHLSTVEVAHLIKMAADLERISDNLINETPLGEIP